MTALCWLVQVVIYFPAGELLGECSGRKSRSVVELLWVTVFADANFSSGAQTGVPAQCHQSCPPACVSLAAPCSSEYQGHSFLVATTLLYTCYFLLFNLAVKSKRLLAPCSLVG